MCNSDRGSFEDANRVHIELLGGRAAIGVVSPVGDDFQKFVKRHVNHTSRLNITSKDLMHQMVVEQHYTYL